MSFLIKGINVHRGRCYECPCLDSEYGECNVLKKDAHYVEEEECPLIELPDHGDGCISSKYSDKETIYGYSVEQLALIATIMKNKGITPEEATEIYMNVNEVVKIVVEEQQKIVKYVLEDLKL